MMRILYIVALIGLSTSLLFSQQTGADEKPVNTEPASFPNAIIIGDYNPETGGGTKKLPQKPKPMNQSSLDSLNDNEKQKFLLLPPEKIPANFELPTFPAGYLEASFGSFMTPRAMAGFDFDVDRFNFFVNGGYESSAGHIDDAEYSKITANADIDYIAPEKFWLFGGSKTRTKFRFMNDGFNNYAADSSNLESINATNIALGTQTESNYNGFRFNSKLGFNLFSLADKSDDGTEFGINAGLGLLNPFGTDAIGLNGELDYRTTNGNGNSLFLVNGVFPIAKGDVSFTIEPGVQFSDNTIGGGNVALYANIELAMQMSDYFTMYAKANTGMKDNSLTVMYGYNPYMSSSPIVDFKHTIAKGELIFNYHPFTFVSAVFGASYELNNNDIAMTNDSNTFRFSPTYVGGNRLRAFAQLFYDITEMSRITSDFALNITSQDSTDEQLTYVPLVEFATNYHYNFTKEFGTVIGVSYVGSRYADLANTLELDGYFNINVKAEYYFSDNLGAFVNFENILNQDIYIWNGYRQRGIFAQLGVLYTF